MTIDLLGKLQAPPLAKNSSSRGGTTELVELTFIVINIFLGCGTVKGFVCMHEALNRNPPEYKWAAEEIRNSKWCRDVKERRCGEDVQCMLAGEL